jgi:hypothetical protein
VKLVIPQEIDRGGKDVEAWRPLLTTSTTTTFLPVCHFIPLLTFGFDGEGI